MNLQDLEQLEAEEESLAYLTPRKPEPRIETKANSRRAELLGRCLLFLDYKQPKVFAIRTSHLSVDDLEYMLSASKAWKKNPQACFWKMLKDSTPK